MNTRKTVLTAGAVAAFACSLAFGQQQAGQQSPQSEQQQQSQQASQPSPQAGQQQAQSGQQQGQEAILGSDISDKQVKSKDGQELGKVDDLALLLESGKVGYVLISEQGQSSQEWKPVPASALEISGQGDQVELTVNIDQQKWEQLEAVGEQDIATLGEQERAQQIHEAFGEQFQSSQQSGEPKLASKVMENKLTNQQDQEIGQVTDLVMSPQDGSIEFLLIESDQAQGTFAVAPQAIEESGDAQYQLNISDQDFQQAQELRMEEVAQKSQQAQSQGAQARQEPQLYRFQASESQSSSIYGARQQREQQQSQTEAGSREGIHIQQPAPDVRVQQPAPEVSVQQPAPDVRVQQPPPQIRVQVEQPPPQVSVQQPEPEVNVQQAQPQVSVRQAEPQVSVQQAEPQVSVQRGEPEVSVQREGRAQVQVEREGDPQVIVEQESEAVYGSPEQRRMQESQQRLQNREGQQGQQSSQSQAAEERARQMREQQQQQQEQQQ